MYCLRYECYENKNHLSDPDILLLKWSQNAGKSIFQSIRNQTFSKQCMLPDTLDFTTPSLKKSWNRRCALHFSLTKYEHLFGH